MSVRISSIKGAIHLYSMKIQESLLTPEMASQYADAIKKRDFLIRDISALQNDLKEQEGVVAGMESILALVSKQSSRSEESSESLENPSQEKQSSKPIAATQSQPRKNEVWVSVIDWMGNKEVSVSDVLDYCEKNNMGVTRKQVSNWLNNARLAKKLERVSNGTYRVADTEESISKRFSEFGGRLSLDETTH